MATRKGYVKSSTTATVMRELSAAERAVIRQEKVWNKEAVESARSYLETSPMSRNELIEQLSSSAGEGFTYEQALYAVNKVY